MQSLNAPLMKPPVLCASSPANHDPINFHQTTAVYRVLWRHIPCCDFVSIRGGGTKVNNEQKLSKQTATWWLETIVTDENLAHKNVRIQVSFQTSHMTSRKLRTKSYCAELQLSLLLCILMFRSKGRNIESCELINYSSLTSGKCSWRDTAEVQRRENKLRRALSSSDENRLIRV